MCPWLQEQDYRIIFAWFYEEKGLTTFCEVSHCCCYGNGGTQIFTHRLLSWD